MIVSHHGKKEEEEGERRIMVDYGTYSILKGVNRLNVQNRVRVD